MTGGLTFRIPACVPYWNRGTYRALASCLLRGDWVEGDAVGRLARRLAEHFRVPDILLCGNGRTGIELALRAAGIGHGDEVVLPAFCCRTVVPPVLAVGATPVFADVGPDLCLDAETTEAAATPRTRAVIVPHLFGNPAPIDAIALFCRARGIFLVDDAAQAFGATSEGRVLGTLGDAGIASFGNGKVCFGTGGGALISGDAGFLTKARSIPLERPSRRTAAGRALSVLLRRRFRRLSYPLESAAGRVLRTGGEAAVYRRERIRNVDAAVALSLLETLPANLAARRARVRLYRASLEGADGLSLVPHREGSACLAQVVRLDPPEAGRERASSLIRILKEAGYEVNGSFPMLHLRPEWAAYRRGPLPRAEAFDGTLVELPCEPSVPLGEVERICRIVSSSIGGKRIS